MTVALNTTIAVLTTAMIADILWLARPMPRQVTTQSEFRRRRLWLIRYRTILLLTMTVGFTLYAYTEAKRSDHGNAFRALFIAFQVVVIVRVMRLQFRRPRQATNSS